MTTTTTTKGECLINDTMATLLIEAARARPGMTPSEILDRLHRADADGLFDGKIWGNMSTTEWDQLREDFGVDYL